MTQLLTETEHSTVHGGGGGGGLAGGGFSVKDGADCNYWVVGPTA